MGESSTRAEGSGAKAGPAAPTPRSPAKSSGKTGLLGIALKLLSILVTTIALLLVLALGALWIWSGSDGSLKQAMQLAQRFVPLEFSGVTGAIRDGGTIGHLAYKQDGLKVEVDDARLKWQPSALLDRTLRIDRLVAGSIRFEDKSAPAPKEPSTGPPQSIKLPIKIEVDRFAVDRFQWAGPPPVDVTDIAGSYAYDGQTHQLSVDSVEVMNGRYKATASLTDSAPIKLDAQLSGKLKTDVPGGGTEGLGVTLDANAKGPLTDLAVKANAAADAAAGTGNAPPRASVSARVTPWAEQPVPKADATFSDFDAGALWAEAPHTQLTGEAHVTPLAPVAKGDEAGWHLKADIANALPGPWDKKRVPLERLQAEGDWQNGVALIEQLEAKLGGGTLRAQGKWAGAATTTTAGDPGAVAPAPSAGSDGTWQVQATLDNINPAALHSQMAALPIDGKATVSGQGETIDFDVNLRTNAGKGAAPRTASASAAQLTDDLRQLKLQGASAKGRWSDGRLSLSSLEVRTDDAQLNGALDVRAAGPGGQGELRFTAPGLDVKANGELRENSGAGAATVAATDVAKLLQWVKKLPGVPDSVKQTNASGRATLTARWKGGWSDPALDIKLDAPRLDYVPPPSAESGKSTATVKTSDSVAGAAKAAADSTIRLRDFNASVVGKLSQADIKANGRAEIGERKINLNLAANAGKVGNKPLGESALRGTVKTLDASVLDPAIGNGPWKLAIKNDVPFNWSPTPGAGAFEAGAGKAVLSSPASKGSPSTQATIDWQPVRWRNGELSTKGKLTGLPLAWAELASGGKLAGGRISGDMVFNGDWDVTLGDKLDVEANLYRASGDLNIVTDPEAGLDATVPAGVKEARVSIKSRGSDLNVDLNWQTDKAGQAKGSISTKLTRDGPDGGWTVASDAPLKGNVQLKLPKLGIWSQLAPPGWRLEGEIDTDVRMAGTLSDPRLAGTITADDLALRSIVDGFEFTDGKLRAKVDGQKLTIDEFTLHGAGGKEKGGSISAKGTAELANGKPAVNLTMKIDQLRPSIRTDAEITLSGDIKAALDDKLATVTGGLKVDRARIQLPEDSAPSLGDDVVVRRGDTVASGAKAASTTDKTTAPAAKKPAADQSQQAVKLDVKIDLGDDFRISGFGLGSRLEGKLAVAGESLADPRVTGEIRTAEGKFRAYGQRLDVDRGVIRFTGKPTNPSLDILALRDCLGCDVKAGVEVTGTALLPTVRLYSDPEVPDNDKLSWLVLGRASAADGAEAALLQTAALAFVSGKDSGGGIANKVGLDELSLGGAKGGGSAAGATAVTVGKRFSKNFYAAYERSLSGAVGTLFLFYDLSKRFTIRGQTGERSALDLIYTLKYD